MLADRTFLVTWNSAHCSVLKLSLAEPKWLILRHSAYVLFSSTVDAACYIGKYVPQLRILSVFPNDHRSEKDSCLCETGTHSNMIARFCPISFCTVFIAGITFSWFDF